ncbi:hypothetical protein AX769_08270 [Frondihabitans sp. PAMC 28766]|uniref:Asp23/Gls24 family envelope stress response protein n=1 Tax=Frondihabitans sp. PAMC 28766 TaxID=1795630 RepID=UPI00078E095B|nr:Asp23/Gls24 family envelope stress response protein [Frondihabitans sp. PAMC 28766]AMM20162.1 hypothetical protein AX769_08270 [Frondihabitans sp. PAMC 28766]
MADFTEFGYPTRLLVGGRTVVLDDVIAQIAVLAAEETAGVHSVGRPASRIVPRGFPSAPSVKDSMAGTTVTLCPAGAALGMVMTLEAGKPIPSILHRVRDNIARAVSGFIGVPVTEISVTVIDVHLSAGVEQQDVASLSGWL